MARTEQEYITLCKKQIEQKFSFSNGPGYTQRDLENVIDRLEEKTGVIISLSTLKRLWKDDYKQSPQLATLDALAQLLDYRNWNEFKLNNAQSEFQIVDSGSNITLSGSNSVMPTSDTAAPRTNRTGQTFSAKLHGLRWRVLTAMGLAVMAVSVFALLYAPNAGGAAGKLSGMAIKGPIHFEATKTVSNGIPNTVFFKYDLSNVNADSFFLQQSWNDDHRVRIKPENNVISSIYYESGYHRAKLIANDSIIAKVPVHILSDGWEPHVYHSESEPELIDFRNEKFVSNGMLHIDKDLLKRRGVDFSKRFNTRITNSQVFNVHSDNFTFSTRMKADSVFDRLCGWMDLIIVTELHVFSVSWTSRGCEKYAEYKLGEIVRKGADSDLSGLGCDVYDWQDLEIRVRDRHAEIQLNGRPVYQENYKQDFGKIVSLIYLFDGTGTIDYAKLVDGQGKIAFQDGFTEQQ